MAAKINKNKPRNKLINFEDILKWRHTISGRGTLAWKGGLKGPWMVMQKMLNWLCIAGMVYKIQLK